MPERLQPRERRPRASATRSSSDGLGELEHERRRARCPSCAATCGDGVHEVRVGDLARGQVDVHRHRRRASALQRRAWRQACSSTHAAERDDHPALLGDRDELRGREQPALGVLPAHQRLEAADRAVAEADDRLVDDAQLVALERAAQVALGLQAPDRAGAHAGCRRAPRATRPRSLARYIAASASRSSSSGSSCAPSRRTTPIEADATCTSSPSSENGSANTRAEAPRDPQRHRLVDDVLAQHDELVAAEAPHRVGRPHRVAQARGELAQQLVAARGGRASR